MPSIDHSSIHGTPAPGGGSFPHNERRSSPRFSPQAQQHEALPALPREIEIHSPTKVPLPHIHRGCFTSTAPKITQKNQKQSHPGSLIERPISFAKDEMFEGRPARELTWQDIDIEERELANGTRKMVAVKIWGHPVKDGLKEPPSSGFLRQAATRLGCGKSNMKKDEALVRLGELKATNMAIEQFQRNIRLTKEDHSSQIIRLINIVLSDEFFQRFMTLNDTMEARELTAKVTKKVKEQEFWKDVTEEYNNERPNQAYDSIHYEKDHPYFQGIDPSNCFHLSVHEVTRKWTKLLVAEYK
jgi:hypothetical protein